MQNTAKNTLATMTTTLVIRVSLVGVDLLSLRCWVHVQGTPRGSLRGGQCQVVSPPPGALSEFDHEDRCADHDRHRGEQRVEEPVQEQDELANPGQISVDILHLHQRGGVGLWLQLPEKSDIGVDEHHGGDADDEDGDESHCGDLPCDHQFDTGRESHTETTLKADPGSEKSRGSREHKVRQTNDQLDEMVTYFGG